MHASHVTALDLGQMHAGNNSDLFQLLTVLFAWFHPLAESQVTIMQHLICLNSKYGKNPFQKAVVQNLPHCFHASVNSGFLVGMARLEGKERGGKERYFLSDWMKEEESSVLSSPFVYSLPCPLVQPAPTESWCPLNFAPLMKRPTTLRTHLILFCGLQQLRQRYIMNKEMSKELLTLSLFVLFVITRHNEW